MVERDDIDHELCTELSNPPVVRAEALTMTHFVARFPQYDKDVQNPTLADYRDAAAWYRKAATDFSPGHPSKLVLTEKAKRFELVCRMIQWSKGADALPSKAERAR